ncbi:phenylpyruvate tautomerase, partial [Sarracenia purpurea var. burkii]
VSRTKGWFVRDYACHGKRRSLRLALAFYLSIPWAWLDTRPHTEAPVEDPARRPGQCNLTDCWPPTKVNIPKHHSESQLGSVAISFGGSKESAAFAEIVSMGGINSEVKKKLIETIGAILQKNLSIPTTRFFLKVYDTTAGRNVSKL